MANLLSTLLEITIYSGIILFIILAFKKIFRKAISASLNYLVWMLLIVRLLMPVTIDSGIKLFVLPAAQTPVVQAESGTRPDLGTQLENAGITGYSQQAKLLQNTLQDSFGVASQANTTPAPASINSIWETVAFWAWTGGMALYFAYIVLLQMRFRRMIRQSATTIPDWVFDMVEECKKDLGIKAKIGFSVQTSMISPSLTLSLCPALLLPESMIKHMSRKQIELGIRHELTHYKRGDHIMSLLLMLLRGVYWFNPAVWAAYRMIPADMEAACDARVTARLEKEQKALYVQTILDLGQRPIYAVCPGHGHAGWKKEYGAKDTEHVYEEKICAFRSDGSSFIYVHDAGYVFYNCLPANARKECGCPENRCHECV